MLCCQTTPWCYLNSLPAAEGGGREAGCFPLPLFLPAGDVPHFPNTEKLLFFPPAALKGKRKEKTCSSWGGGQARVEVKPGEGTCIPSFLFGHHGIAMGHKRQISVSASACRTTSAWMQGETLIQLECRNLTSPQSHWPSSAPQALTGHFISQNIHLVSQHLYS